MPLSPGTRVGPYEITGQLGAGGMGEVCRARDTKLGRDVALKVLPEAFATDGDRLSRFQREAQLLAALNHPNIAAIYGLEDVPSTGSGQAGVRAIVMELVEGWTLIGPLPIEDALRIAKQIAEAIEYAHDRGIIHRDLKPANIKVTPDGAMSRSRSTSSSAIDRRGAHRPGGCDHRRGRRGSAGPHPTAGRQEDALDRGECDLAWPARNTWLGVDEAGPTGAGACTLHCATTRRHGVYERQVSHLWRNPEMGYLPKSKGQR